MAYICKNLKKSPLTFFVKSVIIKQHSSADFYLLLFSVFITACIRWKIPIQLSLFGEMVSIADSRFCFKVTRRWFAFVYLRVFIWAMLAVCAVEDTVRYRIPNWAVLAGLAAVFLESVISGRAVDFIVGLLLSAAAAFPFFSLGMTGAGDVKIIALLVAWKGTSGAAAVGIGFIIGAVLALIRMLRQGSICQRFLYFFSYIRKMIQEQEIGLYYDKSRDGCGCVIPLGACFCLGALIASAGGW